MPPQQATEFLIDTNRLARAACPVAPPTASIVRVGNATGFGMLGAIARPSINALTLSGTGTLYRGRTAATGRAKMGTASV